MLDYVIETLEVLRNIAMDHTIKDIDLEKNVDCIKDYLATKDKKLVIEHQN
jgi:hypothetical protein